MVVAVIVPGLVMAMVAVTGLVVIVVVVPGLLVVAGLLMTADHRLRVRRLRNRLVAAVHRHGEAGFFKLGRHIFGRRRVGAVSRGETGGQY